MLCLTNPLLRLKRKVPGAYACVSTRVRTRVVYVCTCVRTWFVYVCVCVLCIRTFERTCVLCIRTCLRTQRFFFLVIIKNVFRKNFRKISGFHPWIFFNFCENFLKTARETPTVYVKISFISQTWKLKQACMKNRTISMHFDEVYLFF